MKIFITNKCNLNCVYCFKDKRKKEPGLDEILSEIRKARKKVIFRGGEPLMRRDVLEILKYARARRLKVGLETNGILLSKRILRYVDELYFVLDTIVFKDWRKITKKGKEEFNKSMKGIKLAKRLGKKVYVDSLLTKLNFDSLKETKKFCGKYCLILRVIENPSVSGFKYNDSMNLPISRACFLGKEGIIYVKAKKRLLNAKKLKYYKKRRLK